MTTIHAAGRFHAPRVLLPAFASHWWLLLIRGLCAIVFGMIAVTHPGQTVVTLLLFFAVYAFIDGLLSIAAAITGGDGAPRTWLVLVGILDIAIGALTFYRPALTGFVLLYFIAFWALATGTMQIVAAIKLRRMITNEVFLIAGGALLILFGFLLLAHPIAGAAALMTTIGVFAIVYGLFLVAFSLRLRSFGAAAQ